MPIDDRTSTQNYPKPNIANTLADDVGRLRTALDDIDTGMASKAPAASPVFTGTAGVPLGSASAPSLYFTGDPNTGLYSPGADQVALTTGGTGRLFIASDGKVGIGTSSPSQMLHVTGNAVIGGSPASQYSVLSVAGDASLQAATPLLNLVNAAGSARFGYIFHTGTAGDLYLLNQEAGALRLGTNNTERARIDSSGRLLVGASSTTADTRLVVVGSSTSLQAAVNFGRNEAATAITADELLATLFFTDNAQNQFASISAAADGAAGAADYPGRIVLSTTADGAASPTERMRIDSAGTTTLTSASATAPFVAKISTSEVARIDSSGRLLVGASAALNFPNRASTQVTPYKQQAGSLAASATTGIAAFFTDTGFAPALTFAKSNNATVGTHTAVADGTALGEVNFSGSDGVEFLTAASISSFVDGAITGGGTNDMPGRIVLSTTLDGASAPTEAFRITNDRVHCYNQAAPAAVDTTATLTVANLKTGIITSSTAAAVTMTLPTGTDTEAGFSGIYTNMTFEWSVINTGATNAVTVQGGTGHTLVGSGTVAASNSGRFASRRTAANTFVTYRLSS